MKECKTCSTVKPLEDFCKDKRVPSGRSGKCKDCERERKSLYYEENKELHAERCASWAKRNPDKRKEITDRYVLANKELVLERQATYRKENKLTVNAKNQRQPARKLAAFVEDVDHQAVYNRDNQTCGICAKVVNPDDFHLDHVVPLARGGEHSYANTQTSHSWCNLKKGSKLMAEIEVGDSHS